VVHLKFGVLVENAGVPFGQIWFDVPKLGPGNPFGDTDGGRQDVSEAMAEA
jgi:hypothetical protein